MLDANIGELLELADLLKHGVTPVAGSVEDQPDRTLQALVMIQSEQRRHKAEKSPFGGGA